MGLLDKVLGKSTVTSADDQPHSEIELCGFIKNKVEEIRSSSSRISHEGIWMTNIAYILGFDSVFYDTSSRQFKAVGRANMYLRRNRVHVNKILPTVQNRLARLCKSPPKYDVRPKSNDPEDKDAARLALQILEMIWDEQKLNRKRIPLYMWVQQCGHAYIKISWDDCMGKQMVDPMTGQMDYEGDVRADIVSPFEIFPDPLAKDFDDCQYIVQAKVRKLDYFKMHYPEKGHLVKEEGAWLLSAQYENRINSLNVNGPSQSGVQQQMKNAAIELTYYEKRSKKYPNGRQITVANGVLLDEKELPLGEIPFAKFDDCVVAGKYYSESIITHLRPIQDQYNRTISQRAAWVNRLLAGKYLAAKGHGLAAEALNDQSGEVVEFNPVPNAPPPTALQTPNIPSYAYEEERSLDGMLYDISGINEVSRGQLPAAGIPAIGMQLLTEQDDTRIGIMTEQHEEAWARVGKLILVAVQKYMQFPRLLKIAGQNKEYMVREFNGEDIEGNDDVIVIRGSTLPGSKILKRQEIMNAFQQGLLGDPAAPETREKVLSMLEFGDVSGIWEDQSLDDLQVRRQIEMIEAEEVPEVYELDNHPYCLIKLNRYRKSDKFQRLSPVSQKILYDTINAHINQAAKILDPTADPDLQMQMQNVGAAQRDLDMAAQTLQEGPASMALSNKLAGAQIKQETEQQ